MTVQSIITKLRYGTFSPHQTYALSVHSGLVHAIFSRQFNIGETNGSFSCFVVEFSVLIVVKLVFRGRDNFLPLRVLIVFVTMSIGYGIS